MPKHCPTGMILNKRNYCIPDRGNLGKGPKLFELKKGELSKYGYNLSDPASDRLSALIKSADTDGFATTNRRLIALQVLNKNVNPSLAAKVSRDSIALHQALGKSLARSNITRARSKSRKR